MKERKNERKNEIKKEWKKERKVQKVVQHIPPVFVYHSFGRYYSPLYRLPALPILPVKSFIFTILPVNLKHGKSSTLTPTQMFYLCAFVGLDQYLPCYSVLSKFYF